MVTGLEYYQESYRKDPYSRWLPNLASNRRWGIDVRNPFQTRYDGPWATKTSSNCSGARSHQLGAPTLRPDDADTAMGDSAAGLRHDRYKVKWYDANGQVQPYSQSDGI